MADKPHEMKNLADQSEHQDLLQALADAEIQVKTLGYEKPAKMHDEDAQLSALLLSSTSTLITALKNDYEAGDFDEMVRRIDQWQAANAQHFAKVATITSSRFALLPFNDLPGLIAAIRREAAELG